MADIIKLIKEQGERSIAELRELSGKLSEQLKHVISLIPEDTRQKSVEDFLNGIRESVLGVAPRKYKRKAKKASAPKRAKKAGKYVQNDIEAAAAQRAAAPRRAKKARKGAGRRGRKKKETALAAEE